MSTDAVIRSTDGVIHDIGYQRYSGARLGRGYALRSLYEHGLRTAFGFGRSGKAKIFPWFVGGIMLMVAAIVTAVGAQEGEAVLGYASYTDVMTLLVVLFCAVIAPELVSRDLRSGVLPLYFSRPLTRTDYALAKVSAVFSAAWLLIAAPLTLMFLGAIFSVDSPGAAWTEIARFAAGLGYAAICAALFGSIATLVASLSGRRAVAAAIIAGFFLLSSAFSGILLGISSAAGNSTMAHLAGLFSPMMMIQGVRGWLFTLAPGDFEPAPIGSLGPVYGIAVLVSVAVCVLLLLARYRRVAR